MDAPVDDSALAALETLAQTKEVWQDANPEILARPQLFMGKRKRLSADAAKRALAAFAELGLSYRDIAPQPQERFLAEAARIDAKIDYACSRWERPQSARSTAPDCEYGSLQRHMADAQTMERFLSISTDDDRKKKGRRPWTDRATFAAWTQSSIDAMAANGGPHDFAALPWAEDIAKRASYLRAQNCMMQAIGPCDFSPAELVRFAEDPRQWGLRSGWMPEGAPKREPMPALDELVRAAEFICGPDGADIAGLLQKFAAAWDAYQTEVQQVFSLWKGWMGPRAKSAPERDFGLEMLAAYADLHEACRQALPSVERMAKTIAAFARIAGRYGSGKPFQSGFLPALDVLSPQEHERRRLQSQAARDARGERGGSFDLGRPAQAAFDEEPYCAIGTFDDYIRNPWRYPPDFFDRHVPWENDPSNTSF